MENMTEEANNNLAMTEDQAGLFYKMINRRPLIDVVQDEDEQKHWNKEFKNSNDITLYSWRNQWLKNIQGNKDHFGAFHRERSVKVFANELLNQPVILVGAGPSLQQNIQYLKLAKEKGIKIIVSHHVLMYLAREDVGIKPDYAVALDAGDRWDEYFAFDKMDFSDVPLMAEMGCNTEQLKRWKGPVYFFKSAHPENSNISKYLKMEIERIVPFSQYPSTIEVGGHAMGSMLGIGLGIMKANTVIFAGCDYCFSPFNGKFYPFDHKIDVVAIRKEDGVERPAPPPPQGQILDIFGNTVFTNGAYLGFKNVMDQGVRVYKATALSKNEDLDFINATEGGALGALNGGNSKWMFYMRLEDAIHHAENKRITLETLKAKAQK